MAASLSESPKIVETPSGAGAGGAPVAPEHSDKEAPIGRLKPLQFWGCLAVAVTIFVFCTGPVWRNPWDISVLNVAIFVSYVPIPFLVLGFLAWNRTLNLRGFFLDTLVLTLIKYSLTFSLALGLWAIAPEPKGLMMAHGARFPVVMAEPAPTPSIIADADTGVIAGAVVDAAGRPVEGALVYVASGLEKFVFAAPDEPLILENNGMGISPRVGVARVRQPVHARSTDGHLHTFIASRQGVALLNAPLLSSGTWTPVSLRDSGYIATIHCSIHQRSGSEKPAHVAVLDHPFSAVTGPDGRFRWTAVPAASLRVAAFHPELGTGDKEVALEAGGAPELTLALAKP